MKTKLNEVFKVNEAGDYGNEKIDKILDSVGAQIKDEGEWLDLALACLDQAGVKLAVQKQIEKLVGAEGHAAVGQKAQAPKSGVPDTRSDKDRYGDISKW